MRSALLDLFLLCAASLLLLFVVDYSDSMRLFLPTYQLLKEHIVIVVAALATLLAVKIFGGDPHLGSR
jgi:hypothetical protein